MYRRDLINLSCGVTLSVLSGCTELVSPLSNHTDTAERPPERTATASPSDESCEAKKQDLPDVSVYNNDGDIRTISVSIIRENSTADSKIVVFNETYQLQPGDKNVTEIAFQPKSTGEDSTYKVKASTGETTSTSHTFVAERPLTYGVTVRVYEDGTVGVGDAHVDFSAPSCE